MRVFNQYLLVILFGISIGACNNRGKDSIEKADSANQANLDTALRQKGVVIDENSSSFLVRVFDICTAASQMTAIAKHQAVSVQVKDFAATLYLELSTIVDSIKMIGNRKNVVMPARVSVDRSEEIESLRSARGRNLDKDFLKHIINSQESAMREMEDAMLDSKDEDVRSFADLTLILFRKYLTTALTLQKSIP